MKKTSPTKPYPSFRPAQILLSNDIISISSAAPVPPTAKQSTSIYAKKRVCCVTSGDQQHFAVDLVSILNYPGIYANTFADTFVYLL